MLQAWASWETCGELADVCSAHWLVSRGQTGGNLPPHKKAKQLKVNETPRPLFLDFLDAMFETSEHGIVVEAFPSGNLPSTMVIFFGYLAVFLSRFFFFFAFLAAR